MPMSTYAFSTKGADENIFINLIRSEQGTGDKLTHFAADLNKLGTNIAGLSKAAQDAIIAQSIEWYYWQGTSYAGQEFFTQTGQLLQYTTATGAGLANAQNKAARYVDKWLAPLVNEHGDFYYPSFGSKYEQWNVSAGSAGVAATAITSTKSQIYIGQGGADSFTGGDKNDMLMGGGGADTLNGGAGNDYLYGGAGADVYNFTGSYGGDWIVDSDGQGSIKVDGLTLAGGKKLTPGYYKDAATGWTYALSSGALVLRKDGSLNQITVRGWQPGQLGINLDDTAVVPVTTTTYSGDFKKKVTDTYYAYFNNNYVRDGNLLEANAQDIITGSSLADNMQGLGGNDALFGAAGDDVIEGGDGDDLLLGGMGQDTLNGGAGRDFIYGSAAGGLDHPLRTTDAPPVAPGPEYTRGLGWVTYDCGTNNGLTTDGLNGAVVLGRDLRRVSFATNEGAWRCAA